MSQYLLSVHAPADAPTEAHGPDEQPSPEHVQAMMQKVFDLEAEMEGAGAFLFGGRLHGVDAATVVHRGEADHLLTDGPFVEAKEHIAGFYIVEADDLDAALTWARKVVDAIGAPIEVRPFAATGKAADHMPA